MVLTSSSRVWADRAGVGASLLCLVHCALTPVLLSFSAVVAHYVPGEEWVHRSLAVVVAALGAVALLTGFRQHGRRLVLGLMTGGLGLIGGAAWFGERLPAHGWEVAVTMAGSALMIAAHRMNHTFCRQCECAGGNCGS